MSTNHNTEPSRSPQVSVQGTRVSLVLRYLRASEASENRSLDSGSDVSEESDDSYEHEQAEMDHQEAEFEALPRHTIVRNSVENSLLSSILDYTVMDPPEICSICQSGLHEPVDPPEISDQDEEVDPDKSLSRLSEEESANRISLLNCSCHAKFHFTCINHWLQHPYDQWIFRAASCPHCRDKFRIRWLGSDGEPDDKSDWGSDEASDGPSDEGLHRAFDEVSDRESYGEIDEMSIWESDWESDQESMSGGSSRDSEEESEGGSEQEYDWDMDRESISEGSSRASEESGNGQGIHLSFGPLRRYLRDRMDRQA